MASSATDATPDGSRNTVIAGFPFKRSTLQHVFQELHPLAISLLSELLKLDWRKRINAIDALDHPYFTTEPLPTPLKDIPKYEDSHELDRRRYRNTRKDNPPAPAIPPPNDFSARDSRMHSRIPTSATSSRIPQQSGPPHHRPYISRVPDMSRAPRSNDGHGPSWRQNDGGGGWRGDGGRYGKDRVPHHKDSYVPAYNGVSERSRGDRDRDRDRGDRDRHMRDRSRRRSRSPPPYGHDRSTSRHI
ncbi:serine/threonine protein kinase, CMGC, CDC2/CDK sub [Ascosphaera pollenicola]|nr:serine/threonine protein kinase, CMGC, CDC2/CDK sub [Ascosphaera pollenicola]